MLQSTLAASMPNQLPEPDIAQPDIAQVIRWRDSSYSADLYIAAVSWLDLFTYLDQTPATEAELRSHFQIKERPTRTMIRLFESWGLLDNIDGKLLASASARRYLSRNSSENISSYIAVMKYKSSVREIYDVLRLDTPDTWHVERGGATNFDELMQTDDFADLNTRGMEERGRIFAPDLVRLLDCTHETAVLDVAGGSGVYSAHLLSRYPNLSAMIFERPPVDQLATQCLAERKLTAPRARVIAGDMFIDPFPQTASLHLYSHVLHNWGPEKVRLLLDKSYQSLLPGGRVAVFSCHPDDRGGRHAPVAEAEYSVLLTTSYEGCCYSFEDMRSLMEGAGFQHVDYRKSICNRSLITARKIAGSSN